MSIATAGNPGMLGCSRLAGVGRLVRPLAVGLAIVSTAAACGSWAPPGLEPRAGVHIVSNGVVPAPGGLEFRWQALDEPALDALAGRENLRAEVNPVSSQFEQIVQVRNWVAAQFPAGTPDPYPPWNAQVILEWIRDGRTGGHCGQYSQVLLQSLAALGFTARYVEIGSHDNPYAHFVTEVWSNDHNKWVVMDADYNLHFERGGVPLGALEVHDAVVGADPRPVEIRPGPRHADHNDPSRLPRGTMEFYYYVRFHLKADHLSRPDEAPFDRFGDMVEWHDKWTTPWEKTGLDSPFPRERLTKLRTYDRGAVLTRLNQVHLQVSVAGDSVYVRLRDNVWGLRGYEYRTLGEGLPGDWRPVSSSFREPVGAVPKTIEVRGVNMRGIAGPASVVSIRPAR